MKLNSERLRLHKIKIGAHKLKNRSSKHTAKIRAMKPIFRCMSNEELETMIKNDVFDAMYEIDRRERHRDKREIRMNRYKEKLAAKRAAKAAKAANTNTK